MAKLYKLTVATLALLFSALMPLVAKAQHAPNYARQQAPPKVVFIGDYLTYYWATAFAANPNWINKGSTGEAEFGATSTSWVLAAFQSEVVSLHPTVVHILIGLGDADATDDASFQLAVPEFVTNLEAIVQEAKAANIKVVLGTEPSVLAFSGQLEAINSVIASYGAANKIPVINYADALSGSIGSRLLPPQSSDIGGDTFEQYGGGPYLAPPATTLSFPDSYNYLPTAAGYSLMTQMAEETVSTLNLTLKGGWLQNVQQENDNEGTPLGPAPPATNVSTVTPGAVLQFTPIGLYSDGSQHPLLNTTFEGFQGTWTSSNPVVMYVSPAGLAWSNSPWTAIIRYTSPSGVSFNEWVMYVTPGHG
jgi:lysophospholipase L1-like esterase